MCPLGMPCQSVGRRPTIAGNYLFINFHCFKALSTQFPRAKLLNDRSFFYLFTYFLVPFVLNFQLLVYTEIKPTFIITHFRLLRSPNFDSVLKD